MRSSPPSHLFLSHFYAAVFYYAVVREAAEGRPAK